MDVRHEAMTTIPLPRRDSALWVAALAAIWMLVDYPIGLWLFLFVACLHRNA